VYCHIIAIVKNQLKTLTFINIYIYIKTLHKLFINNLLIYVYINKQNKQNNILR